VQAEIFALRAAGCRLRAIARALAERGIVAPGGWPFATPMLAHPEQSDQDDPRRR